MLGLEDFDIALHDRLLTLLDSHGPTDIDWLTRRARKELRDARISDEAVSGCIASSTLLVGRADGTVVRLIDLLDGQILTHRVTASTRGRRDLWTNLSLQPLVTSLAGGPLPLAGGGQLTAAAHGHEALLGPDGWLPPAEPGDLLGLRVRAGVVDVETIPADSLSSPADEQRVRSVLARHYRTERWWNGTEDLATRPAELNRAIGHALLEQPGLLASPQLPLNELLYDVLEQAREDHHWRDFAAVRNGFCVSFSIEGMPEALDMQLKARAEKYGMSQDQFVIAVLGHLAWRTPFAEDMGPWDAWDPDPIGEPTDTTRTIASVSEIGTRLEATPES